MSKTRADGEGRAFAEDRVAAEAARNEGEEFRASPRKRARSVRATADALNASLEHMKVVEEMRTTLRQIRDMNKLDSN